MAPLRGWGPKGERVRGFAPHGPWRTLTFLRRSYHRLTAACVFDSPINGECFRAYVEQKARADPQTRRHRHLTISTVGSALRRMIRLQATGSGTCCLLTRLNSMEQAFAKIKHWMRAAQKRTVGDGGTLAEAIQLRECSNYFATAGYASANI
jgi:hypothetical protein